MTSKASSMADLELTASKGCTSIVRSLVLISCSLHIRSQVPLRSTAASRSARPSFNKALWASSLARSCALLSSSWEGYQPEH